MYFIIINFNVLFPFHFYHYHLTVYDHLLIPKYYPNYQYLLNLYLNPLDFDCPLIIISIIIIFTIGLFIIRQTITKGFLFQSFRVYHGNFHHFLHHTLIQESITKQLPFPFFQFIFSVLLLSFSFLVPSTFFQFLLWIKVL